LTSSDVLPVATSENHDGGASVRFCPSCGERFDVTAFVQEYWTAGSTVFHVWCKSCGFAGDVVPTVRMIGYEPAHD